MMNKQSLWFLTLLSLVLVLGVYYVTMPNDLLKTEKTKNVNSEVTVDVEENDMLVALRVERDEEAPGLPDLTGGFFFLTVIYIKRTYTLVFC